MNFIDHEKIRRHKKTVKYLWNFQPRFVRIGFIGFFCFCLFILIGDQMLQIFYGTPPMEIKQSMAYLFVVIFAVLAFEALVDALDKLGKLD